MNTDDFMVVIEARMNSSRLPGKVLLELSGYSAIEFMIRRIAKLIPVDQIVIATTESFSDNLLVEHLSSLGVRVFRGSEEDVMGRVIGAVKASDKKHIISLTGDCPLIDHRIVQRVCVAFLDSKADYISNFIPQYFPDGMEVQVFSKTALDKAEKLSRSPHEREHTGLIFRNNPEKFKLATYVVDSPAEHWPSLGLTLDERPDYELISLIIEHFSPNIGFSCVDIVDFLRRNPELILINQHVTRRR